MIEVPADAARELASLRQALESGDPRLLGRAISRIEMDDASIEPLLSAAFSTERNTPMIGITGPPGAGKSTLLDRLVEQYRKASQRVAVLAVDPSSPISGGAVLGDRVRLTKHNTDTGVFMRSMAARGRQGGLARAAGDALQLLAASGVDRVLVETVGVGQNEVDVSHYAETVVVVQTPAGGDALQAIKAGLLEIADIVVVNKADLPGAAKTVAELRDALARQSGSAPGHVDWDKPILSLQANSGDGIAELAAAIESHRRYLVSNTDYARWRAARRVRERLIEIAYADLVRGARERLARHPDLDSMIARVLDGQLDPHRAARGMLQSREP